MDEKFFNLVRNLQHIQLTCIAPASQPALPLAPLDRWSALWRTENPNVRYDAVTDELFRCPRAPLTPEHLARGGRRYGAEVGERLVLALTRP